MEVGAEGAEEAHGVHGPAANLCVRSGGHPIRGSGQEPLEEWPGAGLAQSLWGTGAAPLMCPHWSWVSHLLPFVCVWEGLPLGLVLRSFSILDHHPVLLTSLSSVLTRQTDHPPRASASLPLSPASSLPFSLKRKHLLVSHPEHVASTPPPSAIQASSLISTGSRKPAPHSSNEQSAHGQERRKGVLSFGSLPQCFQTFHPVRECMT